MCGQGVVEELVCILHIEDCLYTRTFYADSAFFKKGKESLGRIRD